MFLFGRQLRFSHLIFKLGFILREIPLGFLISGLLSLSIIFVIAVTSLILGHMMLSALTGHLCYSNYTTIDMFPSLLKERKGFPCLKSFLISLSFPIPNQTMLSHSFLHYHHIIYIYFPMHALISCHEPGDISFI